MMNPIGQSYADMFHVNGEQLREVENQIIEKWKTENKLDVIPYVHQIFKAEKEYLVIFNIYRKE